MNVALIAVAAAVGLLALTSFVVTYPLLLSLVAGAGLLAWWRRWTVRADALEMSHA